MSMRWLMMMVVWALPVMAQAKVVIDEIKPAGVRAWVVEDRSVPAFHLSLRFADAGYASDAKDKQGLAYLAASMLMEGTKKHDDDAFHRALEDHAIGLDVSVSADAMSIEMMSLSEHAQEAFGLLREMIEQPRLAEESLAQVKERTLAAIRRMKESPDAVAAEQWMKMAFGDHPYAQLRMGTAETIAAITVDDIRTFLEGQLARNRLLIVSVGDLDEDVVEDQLDAALSSLPKKQAAPVEIADVSIKPAGKWQDVTLNLPQTVLRFGRQGIKRSDPQFYAAYVLNQIVGGMSLTSRLGDEVREKRGLTYGIGTAFDTMAHADVWMGSFATRADQDAKAMKVVEQTLAEIVEKGITQEEFDQAVGYITGSFPLALDSNAGIANYLMVMQLYDLGKDYLEKRNEYFRSVTLEQVNGLVRELLDPNYLMVVRVGAPHAPKSSHTKEP